MNAGVGLQLNFFTMVYRPYKKTTLIAAVHIICQLLKYPYTYRCLASYNIIQWLFLIYKPFTHCKCFNERQCNYLNKFDVTKITTFLDVTFIGRNFNDHHNTM